MDYLDILWDQDDDPEGNVEHIAQHGLSRQNVEEVLADPVRRGTSRNSGRPIVWGYTGDGRYILVVYEQIDKDTIRPVTAYEVDEP